MIIIRERQAREESQSRARQALLKMTVNVIITKDDTRLATRDAPQRDTIARKRKMKMKTTITHDIQGSQEDMTARWMTTAICRTLGVILVVIPVVVNLRLKMMASRADVQRVDARAETTPNLKKIITVK